MPTVLSVSSRTLLLKNERSEGSVKEISVPHLRAQLLVGITEMQALLTELTVFRDQMPAQVLPTTFLQPACFGQAEKFALSRAVRCSSVLHVGDFWRGACDSGLQQVCGVVEQGDCEPASELQWKASLGHPQQACHC
jgi:hypothetical protein